MKTKQNDVIAVHGMLYMLRHSKRAKGTEALKLTFILIPVQRIKSEEISQLMHAYTHQDDVIIISGLHLSKEHNNHFVCSRLIFDVSTSFICHIPCI